MTFEMSCGAETVKVNFPFSTVSLGRPSNLGVPAYARPRLWKPWLDVNIMSPQSPTIFATICVQPKCYYPRIG